MINKTILNELFGFGKKPKEEPFKRPERTFDINLSDKVKKLNVNMLPPDLKQLAIQWPVLSKQKTGYEHYIQNYNELYDGKGKPFKPNQINKINEMFLLRTMIENRYEAYKSHSKEIDRALDSIIKFTNDKLMFMFFLIETHGGSGWCYSFADKNVYHYYGHDDGVGFFTDWDVKKITFKTPYKQWIELWNKVSLLQSPAQSGWGDDDAPDFTMLNCLDLKTGKINKNCRPF